MNSTGRKQAKQLGKVFIKNGLPTSPHSLEELEILPDVKESILRLLDDSTLREEYINKGIMQAKKYSWKKSSYPLIKEIDSLCQ